MWVIEGVSSPSLLMRDLVVQIKYTTTTDDDDGDDAYVDLRWFVEFMVRLYVP